VRQHGSGRACYYGDRLPEGSCEACKAARRTYVRSWYQTPSGKESAAEAKRRYNATAKGFLANIRGAAQWRGRT